MRIRKKSWAEPELKCCDFFVQNPQDFRGKWNTLFKNNQPIHLELGSGKGQFISSISSKNFNINYISIDIKNEMLAYSRRNVVKRFYEINRNVDNLLLVGFDISRINLIMSFNDKVERIYINFCNPWPKSKHKKRRLTFPRQLIQYKEFLCSYGEIYFKTDDNTLFEESIVYFKQTGFKINYITYDLTRENIANNIITEHEQMYMKKGIKINFLIAQIDC